MIQPIYQQSKQGSSQGIQPIYGQGSTYQYKAPAQKSTPTPTATSKPTSKSSTTIQQPQTALSKAEGVIKKISDTITFAFTKPQIISPVPGIKPLTTQPTPITKPISITPEQKKLTIQQLTKAFPQTAQAVTDLKSPGKTDIKKAATDAWKVIKDAFIEGTKRTTERNFTTSKTPGEAVSKELKYYTGIANAALSPISAVFAALNNSNARSVTKAIAVPFVLAGEGASKTSDAVIDALPLDKKTKETIKPAFAEVSSLAAQFALGELIHISTKQAKGTISRVGGETFEKFTKNVIEESGSPKTINLTKEQAQNVLRNLGDKATTDLFKTLDVKTRIEAVKKGATIEIPAEKITRIVDKPYWEKIKSLFNVKPTDVTSVSVGAPVTKSGFAGYLESGEKTPQQIIDTVMKSGQENTPEGKALLQVAMEAKNTGQNIIVSTSSGEAGKYKNIELKYIHNTEKSPNMGSRFGQDTEPAGKYVNLMEEGQATAPEGWETGSVKFNNPLIVDWGGGYGEKSNWKNVLSKRYDGKTGKELSIAIVKDGYDGIVTLDGGKASEVVSLARFVETKTSSPIQEAKKYRSTVNINDPNDLQYLSRILSEDQIKDIKSGKMTNHRGTSYEDLAKVNIVSGETKPFTIDTLNPTGGLYVDYTPQQRMEAPLGKNITTLDKTMGKPSDDIITIYRGVSKSGRKINPGDFVTTTIEGAKGYGSNVISKKVKLSDVLDDKTDPLGGEYLYRPKVQPIKSNKAAQRITSEEDQSLLKSEMAQEEALKETLKSNKVVEELTQKQQAIEQAKQENQVKKSILEQFNTPTIRAMRAIKRAVVTLENKGLDPTNVSSSQSYKDHIESVMEAIKTTSEDVALDYIRNELPDALTSASTRQELQEIKVLKSRIEPKEVPVNRSQLPVGEGAPKVSRLEARMKGVMDKATPQQIEELGLSTFNTMNRKETIAKAAEYIINNQKEALDVLRGSVQPPEGIPPEAIYVALTQQAKGDLTLATKLASLQATAIGQRLSLLAELDPNSPVKLLNQVYNVREEKFKKRYAGKTVKEVKEKIVKKAIERAKKPDKYDINKLIDLIETC